MRKSAKFPREIRQVTKIFAFSLATSEKPPRRPPRTALSPAARCVDVTSSRSSAPTASRATDRFNASRDDRRQPARAESQRARQGVPRRWLRLRIRVYQQHGHVAHPRRRLGGRYVRAVRPTSTMFFLRRAETCVWLWTARFFPRLAPRPLRARAPPTTASPKESRESDEITNDMTPSDLSDVARVSPRLLRARTQASRTKSNRPRSRFGRAARTPPDALVDASRSTRRRDAGALARRGFDVESALSTSAERRDWRDFSLRRLALFLDRIESLDHDGRDCKNDCVVLVTKDRL